VWLCGRSGPQKSQVQQVTCLKHHDFTDSQPELLTAALSHLHPSGIKHRPNRQGVYLQLEQTVSFQTTDRIKFIKKLATPVLSGVTALASQVAHAGPALPWDGPITTVVNNLTGPVATGISTVAFLAAGAALIFGGDDLGGIAKKLLYVVLGVALIVFGANFLSMIGLVNSGALV
jgi:type IV secretory pathway VirB2 component (pilin)